MDHTAWEHQVDDIAELLVWVGLRQAPTLGSSRFVCVDGRAGAGKTTLGQAMLRSAREVGSARLLQMDDMYEGWTGLGDVSARIERDLVMPLHRGDPGRYRRYDWHKGAFAERHTVDPVDLLILEGVGSASASYRDRVTLLVWVDAPMDLRLARGVARDGQAMLPEWLAWMDSEDELFARERTRERADVLVDGSGTGDRSVVFV